MLAFFTSLLYFRLSLCGLPGISCSYASAQGQETRHSHLRFAILQPHSRRLSGPEIGEFKDCTVVCNDTALLAVRCSRDFVHAQGTHIHIRRGIRLVASSASMEGGAETQRQPERAPGLAQTKGNSFPGFREFGHLHSESAFRVRRKSQPLSMMRGHSIHSLSSPICTPLSLPRAGCPPIDVLVEDSPVWDIPYLKRRDDVVPSRWGVP